MKPITNYKRQEQDYRKKCQPVMSVTGLNDQGHRCLDRPSSQWPAQVTLKENSWAEKCFKLVAVKTTVSYQVLKYKEY